MTGEIGRLVRLYWDGTCSPVDVLEDHLAAAEQLNEDLNAFTRFMPDTARADALASAQRYAQGRPLSQLDGVPVTVKDLIDVQGVPTTAGSMASDPEPARRDATVVGRLRSQGAIVFGKVNLLEYANGVVHPDFGSARNPWNLDRSSGGSSSGSGSAVAAGLGFGSVGTDTLGSVRFPAAWCGTVGMKPTRGAIATSGVIPLSGTLDHVGVLARTVADTRRLFEGLSRDHMPPTGDRPLRIGVVEPPHPADREVEEACAAVVQRLPDHACELVSLPPFPWEDANAAALVILYSEALEIHQDRLAARWQGYSEASRGRLLAGAVLSAPDYYRARLVREVLRAEWAALLRRSAVDAVVLPTLPVTAPWEGGEAKVRDLGGITLYTGPFAFLGVPAVSLPVALSADGMPISLQVCGGEARDGFILDVAARVEDARGDWPRPPIFHDPFAAVR